MTTLTRSDLASRLNRQQISLAEVARDPNLSAEFKQAVQSADLDGDGRICSSAEIEKLFAVLDGFDHNGSSRSLLQTDAVSRLLGLATAVPSLTREEMARQLEGKQVGVLNLLNSELPADTRRNLARADLDRNGAIRGDTEKRALFDRLDARDHDGNPSSVDRDAVVDTVLNLAGPETAGPVAGVPGTPQLPAGRLVGNPRATGYYPHNSRMEGGFVDKQDQPLNTLQDYLDGRADYVSIAMDKRLYQNGTVHYGDRFRIPELEAHYGRPIEFRAVDTGSAFTDKGYSRIDICTGSRADSEQAALNRTLTLRKLD